MSEVVPQTVNSSANKIAPAISSTTAAMIQENTSPKSRRTLSKTKMETISPFLSPKSAASYERSSSPAKTARPSTQNDDQTYSRKSTRPPSLFRNSSTATLSNLNGSPLTRRPGKALTNRSVSTEKSRPISAFGMQTFIDNKNLSKQIRDQGADFFDVKSETKKLEQELTALETRVKNLKKEENSAVKRLEKTQDQCQKVIENKMRHQTELIDKEFRKQQTMANLAKQRKQQMESKMKLNEDILCSMINTMNFKNKQSQEVKQQLQAVNDAYAKELAEKNKVRDKTIKEIQNLRQRIVEGRKTKEEAAKEFALITNYNTKIDTEKSRQDEINQRLEELTREEEVLLDRIRATNTLQESTFSKMEKVFSMRVSADKPMELP